MNKKIKLTAAAFAADMMLLFLVLSLTSAVSSLISIAQSSPENLQMLLPINIKTQGCRLGFVLLSVIALLRGRKDATSGVLFVLSAVFFFLQNSSLGGIVAAAVFVLLAVDCFLGGKLGATPVAYILPVAALAATFLLVKTSLDYWLPIIQDTIQRCSGFMDTEQLVTLMLPSLIAIVTLCYVGIGLLFAGIAFIPGAAREEGYIGMAGHVLLLLFAPGLWILVWIFRTTKFLNKTPGTAAQSPFGQLILCMLVPFYAIFWFWKQAKRSDALAASRGIPSDTATAALILAIFFPFASYIIVQNTINKACLAPAPVAEPAEPAEPAYFA